MTVRELPKVKIGVKLYYKDDRLEEFRAVDNPHDRIHFSDRPSFETSAKKFCKYCSKPLKPPYLEICKKCCKKIAKGEI